MSFWAFIAILVILGIMFGALYLSKMATIREEAELEKKKRIRSMRNDLIDIDELIHTLLVYDRNPELLSAFALKMEKVINEGLQLLPGNEDLLRDLADLEKTNQQINALREQAKDPETPSSDRQIFLIKKNFSKTIKLLKELQANGEVTELEAGNHRARLVRSSLLLEVDAYRKQGNDAKARGETSSAANFFKHAKELLVNTDIKFTDKTQHIKNISRDISNLYVSEPSTEDKKDSGNPF